MNTQLAKPNEDNRLAVLVDNPDYQSRIRALMGERAPQFVSSVLAIGKTLVDVEPRSLLGAAVTAATLDLPINQNLGFAWIVPYRDGQGPKIAQFQLGYKGYVQLAMRTGQYRFINACVVYEGELLKYDKLTGELKLNEEARTSEKVVGYASYFRTLNGFEHAIYWTVEKVRAHAQRFSQSFRKGYGPWKDDFDAMGLKTVLKWNLSHWGILSIQMEKALYEDQGARHDWRAESFYPDGNDAIGGPAGLPANGAPALTQGEGGVPTGEKNVTPRADRGQRAEDRGQRAEDRGQKTEGRKKKAADAPPPKSDLGPPASDLSVSAQVEAKLKEGGYEPAELVQVAIRNNWCETTTKTLPEIGDEKLKFFLEDWESVIVELAAGRQRKAAKGEKPPFD